MAGGSSGGSAPASTTTTTTAPTPVFVLNPFLGDINPGTADGAKLFNKATEEATTKLTITQRNAKDILSHFRKEAGTFGWGPLIGSIPINVAGGSLSILKDSRRLTLEQVQKASRRTWMALTPTINYADPLPADFDVVDIDPGTNAAQRPQFYRRICSLMISKRIEGTLDKASLASLMLEKRKFEWTQSDGTLVNDGPTMFVVPHPFQNQSFGKGRDFLPQTQPLPCEDGKI